MRRGLLTGVLVLGWAASARSEVVLHEYFDFTGKSSPAARALRGASATTALVPPLDNAVDGLDDSPRLPPDPAEDNGAVIPPDPAERGSSTGDRSGQGAKSEGDTGRYRLDGNTSTPSLVGYSDPFSPSIPPYKRMFAYDSVNDALELVVARTELTPVGVGGTVRPADDQFFAELELRAEGSKPVRLPTVGAGFRILSAKVSPERPFALLQDSAENLFVRDLPAGTVTWTAHMAVDRRVFGSAFPDVHWSTLRPYLPELPAIVATAATPVLAKAGATTSQRPAQALRRLVQYFRSFSPEEKLYTTTGVQLYHDIALSQQGVCRHRSFAFVVSALALGLPSRFVRNEAHAWVEVFDGKLWHRVDLGGAASDVALSGELNAPHQPPADPYVWPSTGESGQGMINRALDAGGNGQPGNPGARQGANTQSSPNGVNPSAQPADSAITPGGAPVPGQAPGDDAADSTATTDDAVEASASQYPTQLTVQFGGATLKRGERFSLSGTARQPAGNACALMRIEVDLIERTSKATFGIGTLVTDDKGRYGGELVVPNRVPVGDYQVNVKTPGNQSCAPATAQ